MTRAIIGVGAVRVLLGAHRSVPAVALVLACVIIGAESCEVIGQTDGSAPSVTLRVSRSPYPGIDTGGAGQHYPAVPVGQHVDDAVLIDAAEDAFRYVYGSGSDPTPVCVFTAKAVETDGGPSHLANVGGGRNCGGERRDSRCAQIGEGWDPYAVAGGECAAFGVQACSGIC